MLFQEALQMFDAHLAAHGRTQKTRYGYFRDVFRFQKHIESRENLPIRPSEIRPTHVEQYIESLNSNMQPVSVNRILDALTSFFTCLQIFGVVSSNPARAVPRVSTERRERVFMTQGQLAEFLNGVDDCLPRCVFYTLAYTGIRVSELTKLIVRDVRLEARKILIHGKGRRERTIPIHDILHSKLVEFIRHEHENADAYDSFFRTHKTNSLSPSTVNRWISDRVIDLDWDLKVTAHTFRHTFGYMYIDEGGNVVELQKLFGHENLRVTSVYSHTTHARLSEGIGRLPRF